MPASALGFLCMKNFELFSKVVLDSVSPSVFIFGTAATGEMAVMLSLPWGLLGRVCDRPLPCSVNYGTPSFLLHTFPALWACPGAMQQGCGPVLKDGSPAVCLKDFLPFSQAHLPLGQSNSCGSVLPHSLATMTKDSESRRMLRGRYLLNPTYVCG